MSTELSYFSHVIAAWAGGSEGSRHSKQQAAVTEADILEEAGKAKQQISLGVAARGKKKARCRYVRKQQSLILHLANSLTAMLDEGMEGGGSNERGRAAVELLFRGLEQVHRHLVSEFGAYVDADAAIPELCRRKAAGHIREADRRLRRTFVARGVEAELIEVVLAPAREVMDNPRGSISQRQLQWVYELLGELERLPQRPRLKYSLDMEIMLLACYLNLNTVQYYEYCVERCKRFRDEAGDAVEAAVAIRRLLVFVRQFVLKADFAYRPKRKTIKELMEGWLQSELELLERSVPARVRELGVKVEADEKPRLNITGIEFGYLLRLLVDARIVHAKGATLLKLIAPVFNQRDGSPMNYNTLSSRYGSWSAGTTAAVRARLKQAIEYSVKYHGDGSGE